MAALTDDQIRAILSQQVASAEKHDDDELVASRSRALDYFFGRMDAYVPPEPNRSKVVSRDVADTMGWIMPQMMRVFLNSANFAVAEPVEREDVRFADHVTLGLNHVFFKANDGEGVCYNATWEALLFGDGIVKTYRDDTPQYAVSFHSGLLGEQLAMLLQPNEDGETPEVLAQSERIEVIEDPETGMQIPIPVYDVKIKRMKAKGRYVIEAIPRDHYRKNASATSTDDALFQSHVERKTRSELIEMGYDRDLVLSIPTGTNVENADYRGFDIEQDALDIATEEVDYHECFAILDVDDDGIAETIRACLGGPDGGVLLDWEVWEDESPFDSIQYEPIPHRFEGRSVYDETSDVQDVKTVLKRQALNNTYATNNPQRLVKGKVHNPEELTAPSFNGAIFGDATTTVEPIAVPFVANHAYEAMAYEDEVIQRRTGVGRQSMALDPEALQNQSATANQNNKDAAYSQVELAARNMAKGWKKVFRKLMRLMIKHQDTPMSLRLKGEEFVDIDPRHWNADMDISINVGLGTGSRDRDMMMLQQVLMNQMALADRFLAAGAQEEAIDMLPLIIDTMTKIAEAAGLRNPSDYYPDDAEALVQALKEKAQAAAQQPNPEVLKAQAEAEATMQLKQVDAQVSMQQAELKAQGDVVKNKAELEADLATREADRQNAVFLEQQRQAFEREKMDREYAFKVWEANQRFALERDKMANAQTLAAMKPDPQPSGAAAN